MFRFATIFAILWILFAALVQQYSRSPEPGADNALERRPRTLMAEPQPPSPSRRPQVRQLNEVAEVEMEPCSTDCVGTAFALDRAGLWMTARHVVGDCQRIVVLAEEVLEVSQVAIHPSADVAVIWTGRELATLSLAGQLRGAGDHGFGFGFPHGVPGEAHGRLLGRLTMRATGSTPYVAPVTAWAEVSRSPADLPALQGISGGPLLDSAGHVIGVMIATSKRRGRFYSAAVSSLEELIDWTGVEAKRADSDTTAAIDPRSYESFGNALRSQARVAQVGCLQDGAAQQRRPLAYGSGWSSRDKL